MKKLLVILTFVFSITMFNVNVKGLENLNSEKINNEYKNEDDDVIAIFNNNQLFYISNDDIYLMAQVVYGESRGEPYKGKIAVASVILNRMLHPKFPNSIKGVIGQNKAFSCVENGKISTSPTQECFSAVMDALKGKDPTKDALFFYNPEIATCNWMKQINKKNSTPIGNHIFFSTY